MVNAIESRISARLPPTVCWIEMAVAMSSRSSERTRRTMFSSAVSNERPRLTSRMTRLNSVETGGRPSRTTSSIAWRKDEPARRAFAMRVIVSGSCLLNALMRPDLRRPSQKRGSMKPTRVPTSRNSGFPRAGMTTDSASITTGTPTVTPAHSIRYSETFSCRSARASSRARLAPKSRCSTTLLIWAIAALDWMAVARFWLSPSPLAALSGRPEAYRSRRALIPLPLLDIAMPTAISRIARAATAAMTRVIVSTAAGLPPC